MSDERVQRVEENEQLFAAFNQAVHEADEQLGVSEASEQYICECSIQECAQRVSLTPEEYTEARSAPRRFFMLPAHPDPAHERIVRETDRYVLVEKTD